MIFFASGLPIAFCFMLINIIGVTLFMGGPKSLFTMILSMYDSLATFVLSPVIFFVLMGELLFHANVTDRAMTALDCWLGKLPGRLSLLAVGAGTLFSSLTGSSMANAAMLGSTLIPEMERRGYHKSMSIGPICGSGGLAIMIPPSSLGVILGSLAYIPIGKLLIGGIMPGIMMAILFASYIIIRCMLNPSLAPAYECARVPLSTKLINTIKYIVPLGIVIFAVIGTMILGIATPTEAAALGAVGSIILGIAYRGFTRHNLKKALLGTFQISVMILMIIGTASGFSQLLGFTGTAKSMVEFTVGLDVSPFMILIMINLIVVIMGCLMEQTSILIISIPLFMPVIQMLGFDPLWFGVLMLINMEIAGNSPPFGLILFVVRGVSPEDTSMMDVYKAALPFVLIEILVLAICIVFPALVLWLPSIMFTG